MNMKKFFFFGIINLLAFIFLIGRVLDILGGNLLNRILVIICAIVLFSTSLACNLIVIWVFDKKRKVGDEEKMADILKKLIK